MDNPDYGYGILAWLMESIGFILVYFQTSWSKQGIVGALKFSWLMGIFLTSSALVGVAAKVELSDISHWFLLTDGFYGIYFTLMGITVGSIYKILNAEERKCNCKST